MSRDTVWGRTVETGRGCGELGMHVPHGRCAGAQWVRYSLPDNAGDAWRLDTPHGRRIWPIVIGSALVCLALTAAIVLASGWLGMHLARTGGNGSTFVTTTPSPGDPNVRNTQKAAQEPEPAPSTQTRHTPATDPAK